MRPELIAGLIILAFTSILSLCTVGGIFAWSAPSAFNWIGGKMFTTVWGDKIWQ